MKKLLYFLVMTLVLVCTGCHSECKLYGALRTYSVVRADLGDTLIGVERKSEKIIPAKEYATITADKNVVVCNRKDSLFDVFLHDGSPLGAKSYLAFDKRVMSKKVFYVGENADSICCFFPRSGVVIGLEVFAMANNVLIRQNSGWAVYSLEGELLWSFPETAQFIKDKSTEKFFVAVSTTKRNVCTSGKVYTLDGKVLHHFTVYKWRQFQRLLSCPVKIGSVPFFEVKNSTVFNL